MQKHYHAHWRASSDTTCCVAHNTASLVQFQGNANPESIIPENLIQFPGPAKQTY